MPLLKKLFIAATLLLSMALNAEPAPADPSVAGPWRVGHSSFTATDANRANRELKTDVWYPVDVDTTGSELSTYLVVEGLDITANIAFDGLQPSAQKFRHLLVFSHGFDGANTQSAPLMEVLASHGFIVVAPAHTGNTSGSDLIVSGEQATLDRVPDLSFSIDFMLTRARNENDIFYQRIHPTRVGVLGHQFGAAATLGMELGFGGAEADPRVVAMLPVSPDVAADSFTEEQLATVSIPTLLMGGSAEAAEQVAENERVFNAITGSAPIYSVDLVGAGRDHFTEVCALGDELIERGSGIDEWPAIGFSSLVSPYNETCMGDALPVDTATRLQNLYTVAFFKAHVSGDLRFARFLTRGYSANNEPLIAFDKKAALATLARFKYW